MNKAFKLHTPFPPAGGQPEAIKTLADGRPGASTLVGVTGSGKTYMMAQVIAQQKKPTGFNALSPQQQEEHRLRIGLRIRVVLEQFWFDSDTTDAEQVLEIEGWQDVLDEEADGAR